MARTRIKICGIGRVEDALAAARAGAILDIDTAQDMATARYADGRTVLLLK